MRKIPSFFYVTFGVFLVCCSAVAIEDNKRSQHPSSRIKSQYLKAHSLGERYKFNPSDGWQAINVTDMTYKYRRDYPQTNSTFVRRNNKEYNKKTLKTNKPLLGIHNVLNYLFKGLKGMGDPVNVTITWYTGHDLKNPSCWANGKWAPTDHSFTCATTLHGWEDRPRCFKFIEVCNTPKKCIFVRVVDSCAGCAPGSKHIDLTRAAFSQLADLKEGIVTVQFREATEPEFWFEDIWGPKLDHYHYHNHNHY